MRKLLLASSAMLGVAGLAAAPALAQESVFNPASTVGGASAFNVPVRQAAPGTIDVHLGGKLQFFVGYAANSDANTSTDKLQGTGFVTLYRLYPGFDGVAANGLKYGVASEIRVSDSTGSGGGATSVSQANRNRDVLYVRRAYGYLSTPELGTLRVGTGDGPQDLFMTADWNGFNDGGWDGTIPSIATTQNFPTWPFPDQGSQYATNKIVYLSPKFAGFDFGVSWEATSTGVNGDNGNGCATGGSATAAAAGSAGTIGNNLSCDLLSSTATSSETRRRRNAVDMAVRYTGQLGPVGFQAFADWWIAGKVNNNSPAETFNYAAGTVSNPRWNNLNVGFGGAQFTYAGVTAGGMVRGGAINDIGNNQSEKQEGAANEIAWVAGAQYQTGPFVFGANYFSQYAAGNQNPAARKSDVIGGYHNQGIAAGATYTVAPGLSLYLDYLYGQVRQNGWNFQTGSQNATSGATHNLHSLVTTQYIGTGLGFAW